MFDAHCHLHFAAFDADRDAVIAEAVRAGVNGLIVADFDSRRREVAREVASAPGVWRTIGVHPWAVASLSDEGLQAEFDAVEHLLGAADATVCGVGETGLDWFRATDATDRARQEFAFRTQIAFAQHFDFPIVIHSVRANHDVLRIVQEMGGVAAGGIAHSFRGSPEEALRFAKLGFDISVSPSLLKGNVGKLKRVVEQVPLASLLVETDSPDQSPDGGRNVPATVARVVDAIAGIRGIDADVVGRMTEENARRRFRLGNEALLA